MTSKLLSSVHFKTGIITSKRLQSTYYGATVKRDSLTVNPSIWLLSLEEMTKLSGRSSLLPFFINRTINKENRTINKENRTINKENRTINKENRTINKENRPTSTQSKVKESKLNKSKLKESKETVAFAPPSISEIEQFCV